MISKLREQLRRIDKTNSIGRVIYQVMDLELIRYRGRQRDCLPEDIEQIINQLEQDWIWLYDSGFSMEPNPKESMNSTQLEKYENMTYLFSELQKFMATNMRLTE